MKKKIILIVFGLISLSCSWVITATPPPVEAGSGGHQGEQARVNSPPLLWDATPAVKVCQVKDLSGALNLRVCGGMNCPVLLELGEGETVHMVQLEGGDGWMKIRTIGGALGWVNADYLSCK